MYERIALNEIEVSFADGLLTAEGHHTSRRSVIVGVSSQGHTGWGEAPAFPSGRWGTADAAWDSLARAETLNGAVPDPPIARAALQAAVADLEARLAGISLHRHLGASSRPVLPRHTFGLADDPELLADAVAVVADAGVEAVKLKVQPGLDTASVAAVRSRFPEIDVAVDANGAYPDSSHPTLTELLALGVSHFEQPLAPHDLDGHRTLRDIGLTVCLDESITSPAEIRRALEAGAADMLAIKVNRFGLEGAGAALNSARDHGVEVKVGGTFDTAIGRRHLLAFACLDGVIDAEVAPPAGYLERDITSYPALIDGKLQPSDAAGIGADPDPDALEALTIRSVVLER